MIFPNLVTYHVCNGCRLPPFEAQSYQYILAGDGIFVRAETPFFSAIVPVVACSVRGLAPLQRVGMRLNYSGLSIGWAKCNSTPTGSQT